MKPYLLFFPFLLFFGCANNRDEIPDSFAAISYHEGVVFTAKQSGPLAIEAWDSVPKKHLASYKIPNAVMYGFAVEKESVWVLLRHKTGMHLLKVHSPTGKVHRYELDISPDSLAIHNKEIWVGGKVYIGGKVDIRRLDSDGKLLGSYSFQHPHVEDLHLESIQKHNNEFYVNFHTSYNQRKPEMIYLYQVNLNTGKIDAVPRNSIMKKPFPLSGHSYNGQPLENYSAVVFYKTNLPYASINHDARYLSPIETYVPLKLKDPIITYSKPDARSISYVSIEGNHLFIIGRVLFGGEFSGLEIGLYDKNGGEQKEAIRLPNGNQLWYAETADELWMGEDNGDAFLLNKKTGTVKRIDQNNAIIDVGKFTLP